MDIRTKQEIKKMYQAIKLMNSVKQTAIYPEMAEEYIHDTELKIRKKCKQYKRVAREFAACERFCYTKDEYGYYNVEYRKIRFKSREEAAEWCNDYWGDHQIRSMYDCTGEYFVSGISFAHMRDNIYLVRIAWGLDL